MSIDSGRPAGRTLIAYFETAPQARQCLLDLRLAGFTPAQLGMAMPRGRPSLADIADALVASRRGDGGGPTIVTVRPGSRSAEAWRVMRRGGGDEAAARPGSALRHSVERALTTPSAAP